MWPSPRRLAAAIILVTAAVVWLPLNQPVEGPVLVVVTPTRGLTTADLLSVALVVVAALLVLGGRRRR